MCAINPRWQKRFSLNVYTSDPDMELDEFEELVGDKTLNMEIKLNEDMRLRWHIWEETKQ